MDKSDESCNGIFGIDDTADIDEHIESENDLNSTPNPVESSSEKATEVDLEKIREEFNGKLSNFKLNGVTIESEVTKVATGAKVEQNYIPPLILKVENASDRAVSLLNLTEVQNEKSPGAAPLVVQRGSSDSNLSANHTVCSATLDNKVNFVSFDSSTDQEVEDRRTSSSQSCLINETESKFLEEQANLKRHLDEALNKCLTLQETSAKQAELIVSLQSTKTLLEKEKQILKKEVEVATKEKENAVIRYATVEKTAIDAKLSKQVAEKRMKEAAKEVEQANNRMKIAINEKNRVCSLFDSKCQELRLCQREVERMKTDLTTLEGKNKWNMSKLQQEIELKTAADKKIQELLDEITQLKLSEISRAKEEVELEKAQVTEKQFMEQSATLILLKHENEERERKIEILEKKLSGLTTDLNDANAKLRQLTAENSVFKRDNDVFKKEIDELQLQLDKEIMKVADLQSKVSEIESLRTQMALAKEENGRVKRDLIDITSNYEELCQEVEKIRGKETELLQFNKELTERCVKLQNECALLNSKAIAVDLENKSIKKDKSHYDNIIERLQKDLQKERELNGDSQRSLSLKLAEKTELTEALQRQVDVFTGDIEAMKKKHSQTVKELSREVNQLRKKIEQSETRPHNSLPPLTATAPPNSENETDKDHSKSDISSLSTASDSDSNRASTPPDFASVSASASNTLQIKEPSKKTLIERILRLQHATARQSEKIDFLENHAATLVAELQKKTKLIQNYMLREQSGALSTFKSDKNKAELSKYGGIMAAVYGGAAVKNPSGEMTLELSLEINKKLQALLEDTILKNITLKVKQTFFNPF